MHSEHVRPVLSRSNTLSAIIIIIKAFDVRCPDIGYIIISFSVHSLPEFGNKVPFSHSNFLLSYFMFTSISLLLGHEIHLYLLFAFPIVRSIGDGAVWSSFTNKMLRTQMSPSHRNFSITKISNFPPILFFVVCGMWWSFTNSKFDAEKLSFTIPSQVCWKMCFSVGCSRSWCCRCCCILCPLTQF